GVDEVELPGGVLAEAGDVEAGVQQGLELPAQRGAAGPHAARHEVAEHVRALELGHGAAAVDVAAGDGAPPVLAPRVGEGGQRQALRGGVAVGVQVAGLGLHQRPAVVAPAAGAGRLDVDLLEAVLAHVGDVEVAGGAVEAEAPRVPEPV